VKGAVPPRATFREVFAVREFRILWSSVLLSTAGDRLALVALTLLVYDRTKSPLLAAAVYAVGYLPWVIGGLFLAEVADRRPRRSVMVFCDAARAVLVAGMVFPHVPIGGLVALLFAATMFQPPFDSAKASITPDILQGERYVLGTAVLQTTLLVGQVAGAVGDLVKEGKVRFFGLSEAGIANEIGAQVDRGDQVLRAAGLKVIETLLVSHTELIANPAAAADSEKRHAMEQILTLLQGTLEARGKVLVKLNVSAENLDAVLGVLPSMRAPTISELSGGGAYALETVVAKSGINTLIPALRDQGATDILELPLSKIVH